MGLPSTWGGVGELAGVGGVGGVSGVGGVGGVLNSYFLSTTPSMAILELLSNDPLQSIELPFHPPRAPLL